MNIRLHSIQSCRQLVCSPDTCTAPLCLVGPTEAKCQAIDAAMHAEKRSPDHERREQDRRERVEMSAIPNWFRDNQI